MGSSRWSSFAHKEPADLAGVLPDPRDLRACCVPGTPGFLILLPLGRTPNPGAARERPVLEVEQLLPLTLDLPTGAGGAGPLSKVSGVTASECVEDERASFNPPPCAEDLDGRSHPLCRTRLRARRTTLLGHYVQVFGWRAALKCADDETLNTWHERLNVLWRNVASPQIAIWAHVIRRREVTSAGGRSRIRGCSRVHISHATQCPEADGERALPRHGTGPTSGLRPGLRQGF